MNLGTPGFVGERMRQARKARGLTATALADLLGITRSLISLYELGKSSPQAELLAKIADKLNLPMSFFTLPLHKAKTKPVFFRSMAAATRLDRNRDESRLEWLGDILLPYLRQYVTFPMVNLPSDIIVDNPLDLNGYDIENIANGVRKYWGLGQGPILNVLSVLEHNGVIIVQTDLKANIQEFSNVYDGNPLIFLGTNSDSATKLRSYAAHELGHFILHSNVTQAQLDDQQIFKLIEDQAAHFAGAFLIPADSFVSEFVLPSLNSFVTIKSKWLAPIGLLIKRTAQLKFVDKDQEQKLWVSYCRKGWRKREALDELIAMEKPVLLSKAINMIIKEGIKSTDQIIAEIPLSNRDIEELLNLPYGFLTPLSPNVKLNDQVPAIAENDYKYAI